MFKMLKPDMYCKDIFNINYEKLQQNGIKCLLFDLDNTIEPVIIPFPDENDVNFFNRLKSMGFKVIVMSNGNKERVMSFTKKLNIEVKHSSMKPFIKSYLEIMYKNNLKPKEIAAIGDQLLTDVFGANNARMTSILVDPISEIELNKTKINRFIEKIILNNFKQRNILVKGNYYE